MAGCAPGVDGVQALTFHAAAAAARYFWPRVFGGGMPRIVESKAAWARDGSRAGSRAPVWRSATLPPRSKGQRSRKPWRTTTHAAGNAGRQPPYDPPTVANVYRAYEEVKRARDLVDFEDILLLTVGMLADRDDVASEVRTRYRWFVVDEYQDVSPLQQRLLDLWLGEGDDLCVVGDPSQTITPSPAPRRAPARVPARHRDNAWSGCTRLPLDAQVVRWPTAHRRCPRSPAHPLGRC